MIQLCSLWDSAYHIKGLALIESLRRHVPEFALYVLALDDKVQDYFAEHTISGVVPVYPSEIESPDVLAAKANRNHTEYCWTLASVLVSFCFDQFRLPSIAYMDADCFVFSDLSPLYAEIGNAPVAVTPHRWTPYQKARLHSAGIYNVGWVYFGNGGRDCLDEWRDSCLEWCYWRVEPDGRFADQGYLNDWPEWWGAHVVQHLGANLAPWNQEQYTYRVNGNLLVVSDGKRADPLLFYHFHGYSEKMQTGYPLHPSVAKHVYEPYEETCKQLQAAG